MDFYVYNVIWYVLLTLAVFAAYSSHKVLGAVAGIGFIVLGFLLLLSPLQIITGEVIVSAS